MVKDFFFFSSRRRHTRSLCDWSSDVCSSDLVLRRAQGRVVEGSLHVGPVALDRDLRRVTVDGTQVKLTFSEFELLGCLMSRPGYAFNRQELLRAIWGDSAYRDPRAIDVHIRHLREKLEPVPEEPNLILTVPGTGYRFRES